jgi:hypothetical protein
MLCGRHTRSDIPLTSVRALVHGNESVDVLIQIAPGRSPVAKNGGRGVFEHSAEFSLIRVEGVADFEVSGGRQIRVWPAVGARQKDVEIILSGPAWATLCHQRGGIAAFAGHSGAGKSTAAALLSSLGYELVADDILPVSFNRNSVPGAWPYLRRLKLHEEPIVQLGLTPTEPVGEKLDKEKYFVRPRFAGDDKWSRLERLYLLEIDSTDSRASIDQITGAEAVRALIDQTYHFSFILGTGRFGDHLAFCTQLASKIAVYCLRRAPSFDAGKDLGSLLCAHLDDGPI